MILVAGCATRGPSADQIDRSMREFQLAAGLREEGRTASALEHLREALKLDPENAEAYLLLGFMKMESGDYIEADKNLRKSIALLLKHERKGGMLAEVRNMHGVCLIELGRYDEAISELKLSANDELNNASHLAWGNIGLVYLRQKKYAEAVGPLKESVRIQPRFCVGYQRLGEALAALNQNEDAEKALVEAIQADEECHNSPMLQSVWRMRGEVRSKLGHYDDATDDWEHCVELAPNTPDGIRCNQLLRKLQ